MKFSAWQTSHKAPDITDAHHWRQSKLIRNHSVSLCWLVAHDKTLCPLCGEGYVTPRTESMQTEYRGKQGTVMLRYAECDACGSEITGDADGRANKRAVLAFRKSVDGLLTGAEIRSAILDRAQIEHQIDQDDTIAALKDELRKINKALDDPRVDLTMTASEVIKELRSALKVIHAWASFPESFDCEQTKRLCMSALGREQ